MTDLTFGLYYDFRCTDPEPAALTWRWAEILEQVTWAERLGFGSVWVSEHHFVDDAYASSTLTLAAALAARTERMWLGTNVMVLPVHHPLRLAEEALTVDALSGGRLRLGVGMGYREADFLPFGLSLRQRRPRFEASLATLRQALRGELVDGVHVAPRPVRHGGPELWIGALSRPAVERAARLADGILSVLPDQIGAYVDARRALGYDDGQVALGYQWVIADDPERAFAAIAPHVLYQVNAYAEFGMFGDAAPLTDAQQLVDLGFYRLLDAEAAVAELLRIISSGPVVDCYSWTLFPGEPVESASERLEYFATRVIPAVRNVTS
ncbi:MAG TPA: LLM class flavin-dependent oxidoreductase [Acidimicrobiales bacterium]|nr:LLM class flavin-dependent oxidoreductase [Acidimicrobiales bacterium]